MNKYLFLDTETTGTALDCGIWQIGGIIRYDDCGKLGILEEFELNCDIFEDDKIDPEAMRMAGMTAEDLAKLPDPGKTYEHFIQILSSHIDKYNVQDKFFIVGYGIEFDVKMLRRWFEGFGDKFFGSWFWMPWICVMTMAGYYMRDVRPTMPNFKLTTVLEQAGIKHEQDKLHGALYDAKQVMLLFDYITKPANMSRHIESQSFNEINGRKVYRIKK
jgi:DNA polymerase III subunit epsilon